MKSFRQRISLCGTLLAMFVAVNYVLLETTAHAPVAPASPWSQYLTPTTVRWVSIAVLVGTLGVVGYLYLLAGWLRGDVRQLRTGIKGLARHGDKSEIADPAYAEITECARELTGLADWLRTEQGRLTDDATRDPLTGLPNRRFLSETLSREIAAAMRTHWPLSLIMVDLDHFKSLNDTYGHQAGDVVLKRTAERMASLVRQSDMVARFGGEEFAIVVPRARMERAMEIAQELRDALRCDRFETGEHSLRVTASFGVAELHACGLTDADALIKQADVALYKAKEAGRDTVVCAKKATPQTPSDAPADSSHDDGAPSVRSGQHQIINPDTMALMGSTFTLLQVIPDRYRVAHDVVQQVVATLHCEKAALHVYDANREQLVSIASLGIPSYQSKGDGAVDAELTAWFRDLRQSGLSHSERTVEPIVLHANAETGAATIRIPLVAHGELLGVVDAEKTGGEVEISKRQKSFLSAVCLIGGTALEICDSFKFVQNRWSGLLEAACGAAWANDSYKREHAPQVSKLAVRLAQELGQNDEEQLELIHLAALLQDIGEFQVPRRIREKKGKLRASERRCVQQHSRASAEVLGKAADTERIAEIILHHHEHYDGTGYPEGLAGEKIPIESRILAVADAYVAMTSNRSYRKAMSDTQAITEIVASAGTQFDRVVVDALLECHAADTLARVESRSNEPLAAAGFTRA